MRTVRSGLSIARRFLWLGLLLTLGSGCGKGADTATDRTTRVTQQAVTLPPGFVEEPIGGTWEQAVGMTFANDGRLFVWEKSGKVWIVDHGVRQEKPFLDISEEVGDWRDFGLLGFALHPNFLQNGYVYLFYVVDYHYLEYFGTADYDPLASIDYHDTIGRLTRYTANAADGHTSVDLSSRKVLLGETISSGVPILHQSHGVGTLLFGTDGTLLASTGDGGSYVDMDLGGPSLGSSNTGLADGIITPKEDVGAFRAQLVDSLSGKILRLDPDTGDGLPSNPFYDASAPRAARSRVWALGFRNPYRMTLRPDTGSHNPADADPGVLYVGDVGWATWEELDVVSKPGQNFGWPIFEGLTESTYSIRNITNFDAPNPLNGGALCARPYFYFRELIVQETRNEPSFPNPCDSSRQIPSSVRPFMHTRPALEWHHDEAETRAPLFDASGEAALVHLGDPNAPVAGSQFDGNCSIGGAWYTGTDFPAEFQNSYFHADFGSKWIKNFVFDASNRLTEVRDFVPKDSADIVTLAAHPSDGGLYYIDYTAALRRIHYVGGGNRPPRVVAEADPQYGASPLTVHFKASGSSDPEMGRLTYRWSFGDESSASTEADPTHTFTAPSQSPAAYTVTVTVTDVAGASSSAQLLIAPNDTPPNAVITSPADGGFFSQASPTQVSLAASIHDAEHSGSQLVCQWTTILHHNDHTHPEKPIKSCSATATITPVGCYDEAYSYEFQLQVRDAVGLVTTESATLYPDCAPRLIAPNGSAEAARPTFVWTPVAGADAYELVVKDASGATRLDTLVTPLDANCGSGTASCSLTPSLLLPAGRASFTVRARNPRSGFGTLSLPQSFSVADQAPVALISRPAPGSTFAAGDSIAVQGGALDSQDGALPASSLLWLTSDWQVLSGASGSFTAPRAPASGDFAIALLARDSSGAIGVARVTLKPDLVPLTFESVPNGLTLTVNGEAHVTPFQARFLRNSSVVISAAGQVLGSREYVFQSWSDAGAGSHGITISSNSTSYVATFTALNAAPRANAGADQLVNASSRVVLDGSASNDPDGDSLTYAWQQIGGVAVTLSGANSARPSFSAPNATSPLTLTFSLTVSDGKLTSPPASVNVRVQPPSGTGLSAEYYDNADFTGSVLRRLDPQIDFNWGLSGPATSISGDTFSVRWSGQLEPSYTETYRFTANTDDGVRLWVNGQLIIDSWSNRFLATDTSGAIPLTAGARVSVKMEYYENFGFASARLSWSSPSQALQVVPAARLYPN